MRCQNLGQARERTDARVGAPWHEGHEDVGERLVEEDPRGRMVPCVVRNFVHCYNVGNSASTPVPATRNCAVDYCIAASIGVTDIRVQ